MLAEPEGAIKGADEPVRARRLVAMTAACLAGRTEARLVGRRGEMPPSTPWWSARSMAAVGW